MNPRKSYVAALTAVTAILTGAAGADVLKIDVNERGDAAPATQSGFDAFLIGGVSAVETGSVARTFGQITVTLSALTGAGYDDRRRTTPVNSGAFSEQALLQDFVFSTDTASGGLRIKVEGLDAGELYPISIWSYDSGSVGMRASDWKANGLLVKDNYIFAGGNLPADNDRYRFDFKVRADQAGAVTIEGSRDASTITTSLAATSAVFLNALRIGDPIEDPDNDIDDDGLPDSVETATGVWVGPNNTGTNPLLADSDSDGLSDSVENPEEDYNGATQPGSNPNLADTDGDGFQDADEVAFLTDPNDAAVSPATTGTLAVDIGEDDTAAALPAPPAVPTPVQAGWKELLGPWTGNFVTPGYPQGIGVSVAGVGSVTVDDRDRGISNVGGTYQNLFREFIFANASGDPGDGMDLTITGLRPNTSYPIILIVFDRASNGRSQWLANDGGGSFVQKALHAFSGTNDAPHFSIRDRMVRFAFTTDSTGKIVIQGRRAADATATNNVFLNGFLIREPLQPIEFTAISTAPGSGDVTLTWTSVPNATYLIESTPDFVSWSPASSTIFGNNNPGATTTTAVVPGEGLPAQRVFLRVRRTDL